MKYYYLNRIAMAVLVALLLFFGTRTLINIASEKHEPEKPGFEVAGDETPHGKAEKPGGGGSEILAALHSADAAQGEKDVALCKVCHSFEKGGATMIGPNLYGVVGHKIAAYEGVTYTPALKGKEGDWTFENLDVWLANPQAFAPGTSMAFPGIPDLKKRANVIAFLNNNSDNPLPLPEAKAEAPAAEDAGEEPAEEASSGQPEILTLIVTADPAKGEAGAALCKVCHTVDKGGAMLIGPNLYNIVGQKIASHEGANYTPALKGKEGDWTYENLDGWLANPQAFAPGTTMAFPGIPDAQKRAEMIAYLRTLSDDPVPLPEAAAAEEPAAEPMMDEEPAAEEPAPAEEPDAEPMMDEEPTDEPAAMDEEPAAEEPAAAEPEEPSVTDEPAADEVMEEGREEIIVNPPTVSESAPSEASTGEPPSESQPQPVYPDEAADEMDESPMAAEPEEPSVTDEPAADEVMEEGREEIIVNPPAEEPASHMGEPASESQPQPVYPDGEPSMDADSDSTGSIAPGDDYLSSQPQPVYPDGEPEGL